MLGKKFTKQMIKWVNINHILTSQICNKNVENHHCKSDLGQKPIKQKKKWVNINHILSPITIRCKLNKFTKSFLLS